MLNLGNVKIPITIMSPDILNKVVLSWNLYVVLQLIYVVYEKLGFGDWNMPTLLITHSIIHPSIKQSILSSIHQFIHAFIHPPIYPSRIPF